MFTPSVEVTIDAWSLNVLADDLAAAEPFVYGLALADGPPPLMFADGHADLPSFTASGLDPQRLLLMPGRTRHYLAALGNLSEVYELFETDATNPLAAYGCDGLTAAVRRVNDWAAGTAPDAWAEAERQEEERAARDLALQDTLERQGVSAAMALKQKYAADDQQRAAALDRRIAEFGLSRPSERR